ncbi:ABC1-domain-containing protein [Martensiomyces pterosporus]|nr:ABC1-domain-containing protein [Martensiomyces pterosporus]
MPEALLTPHPSLCASCVDTAQFAADTQQQQQNGKAKESATTAADYSDLPEEEEETAPKLQASSMPSNRVSRFYHYGSLAVGLGLGALGEATKRWSGFGRSGESSGDASSSLLLNRANIDRIVAKLTKMRGAALKLGQMLSIQDSKDMTPEIAEVLQRVQNSANYVPIAQVDKTMRKQLGPHWRDNFAPFSDEPFAAASIGQVHEAQLSPEMQEKYGFKKVAVKVQYPGVANSIESDLSNLQSLLVMSKLLPRGMYLDNTIKVARKELAWECDYTREADAMVKFGAFLADDPDFEVPRLVGDLSSKMVLTAEHMDGMDMRKLEGYDQETRDYIGTCILRLSLRELFEFEFMQTDPNWANFLYNKATKKIVLLDFGASRGFGKEFLDKYLMTLKTAMDGDREGVRHWSTELGFLTGYEADIMTQAHVDSVLEIGKPFRHQGLYDFGNQDVSDNVRSAIPVMLRHRLTPPPDETYSLHRKLSGAYLLCIKLRARVPCQELFKSITAKYTFGDGTKLTY